MSIYEYDEERHMRQTREEGYEEGREEGESRFCLLVNQLFEAGHPDLAKRAAQDKTFREQMYRKYSL